MEQFSMTLIGTWYFMANDYKGSRQPPVCCFLQAVQSRNINSGSGCIRVLIHNYNA